MDTAIEKCNKYEDCKGIKNLKNTCGLVGEIILCTGFYDNSSADFGCAYDKGNTLQ